LPLQSFLIPVCLRMSIAKVALNKSVPAIILTDLFRTTLSYEYIKTGQASYRSDAIHSNYSHNSGNAYKTFYRFPPASAIALRQQRRPPIRLHDTGMLAAQLAWLMHSTGMRNHPHFLHHGLHKISHPLGFVGLHQPTLQLWIVGGDAGRTGVLIALQGLNTAQRKHKA